MILGFYRKSIDLTYGNLFNVCYRWCFNFEDATQKSYWNTNSFLKAVEKFLDTTRPNQKQLITIYTWYPGHSPSRSEYIYGDGQMTTGWQSTFDAKVNSSVPIVDKVVGMVLSRDPDAVVFVLGDHGSWNYRGIPDEGNQNISKEKIHMDRYGVTFAVYPKTLCPNISSDGYKLQYLFNDLTECLSS